MKHYTQTKNKGGKNAKKKFDKRIAAIIALVCGVLALIGLAIGADLAGTDKPSDGTTSSGGWTNNH